MHKFYETIKQKLDEYTYKSHSISKSRHKKFLKYFRNKLNYIEPTSRKKTLEYTKQIYKLLKIKVDGIDNNDK